MSHRWHVEASLVGCLPDGLITFARREDAIAFLREEVAKEREAGVPLTGNLKAGYFSDNGPYRIFIERCDDPACEWGEES